MPSGLTIVSNRLPISVKKTGSKLEFFDSVGGLATGMSGLINNKRNKWVGWPGIPSDQLTDQDKTKITKELLKRNCYPVFLTQKQLDNFYNGYSNKILWPLFHNLKITTISTKERRDYWQAYQQVNIIFANAIVNLNTHGNHVWINDYQLMLLPQLIRQQLPNIKIGYFLHVPFQRLNDNSLTEIKQLINGLMGADLIGFHIEEYSANFIDCCHDFKFNHMINDTFINNGRSVKIASFPMGIDYDKFSTAIKNNDILDNFNKLKVKYNNLKIILTVDRLDPTKGLIGRVEAYYKLLKQDNKIHQKVVMVMVAVPSRTEIKDYQILQQNLEALIKKVNDEFQTTTWQPIEYIHASLPFNEIAALYQIADVAFIVPLIDGMNLVAKEYIASRKDSGVLILSQTAGAAKELTDALIVDPKKPESLVKSLSQAIVMSSSEQKQRLNNLQKQVSTFTVQKWLGNIISSLNKSPNHTSEPTKSLSLKRQNDLLKSYSAALKRALLLDYDGVLAPFVSDPKQAKPTIQLKKILNQLATNKQNDVVIISGRGKDDLGEWFKEVPLTIVVEHGNLVRPANDREWRTVNNHDTSWKSKIIDLLNPYVTKTPGSFIETKQTSLVWHYRAASQNNIKKNLAELNISLLPLAQKYNLRIDQSNMILEVRLKNISKGQPALKYSKQSNFILAIGDDRTDEDMFEALPQDAWTIKVGSGYTAARFRVRNVDEVHALLKKLSEA